MTDWASLIALLVGALLALGAFGVLRLSTTVSRAPFPGLPCAAGAHWLLGHLPLLGPDQEGGYIAGLRRLAVDLADASGMCSFWLLHQPVVTVVRAAAVRRVLLASSHRDPLPVLGKHFDMFLGPNALVTLMGKQWRFHRNVVARALGPAATAAAGGCMAEVARRLCSAVASRLPRGARALEADVLPLMKMATLDVFGRTAFSHDFGCCAALHRENGAAGCAELPSPPVAAAFDFLTDELSRRLYGDPLKPHNLFYCFPTAANRRHARERALLRGSILGLVAARRSELARGPVVRDDLLARLIAAVAEEEKDQQQSGGGDADEVMCDVLMTLLFGGYDTTSITLAYALHSLAQHPGAEARAAAEARATLGEGAVDVERLQYCRAVLQEALRLYPAAPLTVRNLERPIELGGHALPTGTTVYIPIWWVHRDERNFPRPLEFEPERWVEAGKGGAWVARESDASDASGARIAAGNMDAFVAFSGGARNCVGQRFAMLEAVTLLAALLSKFKFDSVPGYVLEPVNTGVVQKPKHGMPMRISLR
jgi:cytochrome P450